MEISCITKEEPQRLSCSEYGASDIEENRGSPKAQPADKRIRREIANSNERRRMQSINSGFQLLRSLIPRSDGEKLSKAGILQQTADFIQALQAEKSKLLSQTAQMKRYISSLERSENSDSSSGSGASQSPPPKRRKRDTESSDEGISMQFEDLAALDDLRREMADIRRQLEQERCLRLVAEERRSREQVYAAEERRTGQEERVQPLPPVSTLTSGSSQQNQSAVPAVQQATVQTQAPPPPTPPVQCAQPPKKRYMESMPKPTPTPAPRTPRLHEEASSMSRRNLETIVEAIRHLEGDSMFESGKRIPVKVEDSSSGSVSPCYHRDLSPITAVTSHLSAVTSHVMGVAGVQGIPTSGMVQLYSRPPVRSYSSEHYRHHVVAQPASSS